MDHLNAYDIYAGVHYPVPVHLQPAYKGRIRTATSMRVTESLSQEVLSLPIYPEVETQQLYEVVQALKHFVPKDGKRG
jgi:dTDP-4-amino-4,6-dideoxygalactose transaminase